MKKFVYNLEKILQLKEHKEAEVKVQLGLATAEVEKIVKKIKDNKKKGIVNFKITSKDDMIYYQNLVNSIGIENISLQKELSIKQEKRKKVLEKYDEALKDVKKIKKLKEKKYEEYKKEYIKTDIKNIDDIISSNFKTIKEKQLWQDTEE